MFHKCSCGYNGELQVEPQSGKTCCAGCGMIVSDTAIVNELTFQENAAGTSQVVGQFVSSSGPKNLSTGGKNAPSGHSKQSRDITLQRGSRAIHQMANQLRVAGTTVPGAAINLYQAAMNENFVQGRRSQLVVAACLYLACRRIKTPHMLIDFVEATGKNLFVLGATVLKLIRVVKFDYPIADPSLYMERFASRLELGTKVHNVSMTASRLVAHMKRDWMITGRNPSGIWYVTLTF